MFFGLGKPEKTHRCTWRGNLQLFLPQSNRANCLLLCAALYYIQFKSSYAAVRSLALDF